MEWQGGTPVIDGNTLYTIGSAGHIDAFDTASGAIRWSRRLPGSGFIDSAKEYIRGTPHLDHGPVINGRAGGHSLNIAEGVLLAGNLDHGTTLFAFSADTGAHLWTRSNVLSAASTPTIWRHGGREYILTLHSSGAGGLFNATLRCLDPQTGTTVWEQPGLGRIGRELLVHGDLIFLNIDSGGGVDTWACFELTASGLVERWRLDPVYGGISDHTSKFPGGGALLHSEKAWLWVRRTDGPGTYVLMVNPVTGVVEREILNAPGGIQESTHYASDNLLFLPIDEQHGITFPRVHNTAGDFLGTWWPGHPHTTGYQIPWTTPIVDGRIFFRGLDAIYAYDLRQHPNGIPHARFAVSPDNAQALEAQADFSIAPDYMAAVGENLSFDGTLSVAGDDPIASYFWEFGDGATATAAVTSHAYMEAGYFRATLTVTDAAGRVHSRTRTIGIADAPPPAPGGFTVQPGSQTQILLQWLPPGAGELGFRIERKFPDESDWTVVRVVPPGTSEWTDSGLEQNTAYEYRIRTFNEGYFSAYAGPLEASTLDQVFVLFLEAECAENISDRWRVVESETASNGLYLEALLRDLNRPPHPDNIIEFPFEAPFTGNYKVWAYAYGHSGSNDSLHFALNDDWFFSFAFCCTRWDWWPVESYTGLPAGPHVMKIAVREEAARLDKILITTGDAKPTVLGPIGANCASAVNVVAPLIRELIFFDSELEIIFVGVDGRHYHLEQADDLDGPWTPVPQQTATGTGEEILFTGQLSTTTGRKFFRVGVVEPAP